MPRVRHVPFKLYLEYLWHLIAISLISYSQVREVLDNGRARIRNDYKYSTAHLILQREITIICTQESNNIMFRTVRAFRILVYTISSATLWDYGGRVVGC